MTNAMLSQYTNDAGKRVAVAVFAGSPLCAETDLATATDTLRQAVRRFTGRVLVQSWDGDTGALEEMKM